MSSGVVFDGGLASFLLPPDKARLMKTCRCCVLPKHGRNKSGPSRSYVCLSRIVCGTLRLHERRIDIAILFVCPIA